MGVKYYIEEEAARLTFIEGPTVTTFSVHRDDWVQLVNAGPYLEHQETNMIVNDRFYLKTWTNDGNRFLFFKFFEMSLHTPLNLEVDQTLWKFFNSIGKQWIN